MDDSILRGQDRILFFFDSHDLAGWVVLVVSWINTPNNYNSC